MQVYAQFVAAWNDLPLFPNTIMFVAKPRLFLRYIFENRFAVPSFNVSNLEMARAVVEAAMLEDAPVMIQTDFINFNYGGMDELDIARSRLSLFGASGHGKKLLVQLETASADHAERVRR
jgi:fructose/tagatose bisphosphate aldolase